MLNNIYRHLVILSNQIRFKRVSVGLAGNIEDNLMKKPASDQLRFIMYDMAIVKKGTPANLAIPGTFPSDRCRAGERARRA